MNVIPPRRWTEEQFFAWAEAQDGRYEFDGLQPVAMNGGTVRHDHITGNITTALRTRLRGTPCRHYGPNLGVRTIGGRIRYPDALITCARLPGTERVAADVVVVFEVLSPGSGGVDRVELREYAAVPSIRRYVIVESSSIGVLLLYRADGRAAWTAQALTGDDVLELPEVGITVPVAEFYEDVAFGANPAAG